MITITTIIFDVARLFLDGNTQTATVFSYTMNHRTPHRGLPPCHGGGAYAPTTRTII